MKSYERCNAMPARETIYLCFFYCYYGNSRHVHFTDFHQNYNKKHFHFLTFVTSCNLQHNYCQLNLLKKAFQHAKRDKF